MEKDVQWRGVCWAQITLWQGFYCFIMLMAPSTGNMLLKLNLCVGNFFVTLRINASILLQEVVEVKKQQKL